jgi:hypothetical protein
MLAAVCLFDRQDWLTALAALATAIEQQVGIQRSRHVCGNTRSEQRLLQMRRENARLAQINSRLARFEREYLSGSIPPPSTGDFSS